MLDDIIDWFTPRRIFEIVLVGAGVGMQIYADPTGEGDLFNMSNAGMALIGIGIVLEGIGNYFSEDNKK